MAGAVFETPANLTTRPPRVQVRAPPAAAASAVAGPSREFEMQPMMTPAVRRAGDNTTSAQDEDDGDGDGDGEAVVNELPPPTSIPAPRRTTTTANARQPRPQPRVLPLTSDVILERALPRASYRYGLSQAVARSVTLSMAIAGLASALYLVARWREKRSVAGVAIGANGVAIIIDVFMLIDLINTKLPRVSPYAIGGLDFVMLAAALTAGMFVGLSDRGYEEDPAPWRHVMMVTAGFTWATAGVRLLYVVWSCFDCRRVRKTRLEMHRDME